MWTRPPEIDMDDRRDDQARRFEQAHAPWLHELRNVVNTAGVTVSLARRMIDHDDPESAKEMLSMAEQAWASCRALLAEARPPATAIPAKRPVRPPGAGARSRRAPRPHR